MGQLEFYECSVRTIWAITKTEPAATHCRRRPQLTGSLKQSVLPDHLKGNNLAATKKLASHTSFSRIDVFALPGRNRRLGVRLAF